MNLQESSHSEFAIPRNFCSMVSTPRIKIKIPLQSIIMMISYIFMVRYLERCYEACELGRTDFFLEIFFHKVFM